MYEPFGIVEDQRWGMRMNSICLPGQYPRLLDNELSDNKKEPINFQFLVSFAVAVDCSILVNRKVLLKVTSNTYYLLFTSYFFTVSTFDHDNIQNPEPRKLL